MSHILKGGYLHKLFGIFLWEVCLFSIYLFNRVYIGMDSRVLILYFELCSILCCSDCSGFGH